MQHDNRYTWHTIDTVLDLDARVIEVSANPIDDGVILVTVEGRGYALDCTAARRFARVLLQAAEHADGGA